MGWAVGFDDHWARDVGYGVPAWCDSMGCFTKIDRGLAYVCGGEPYGGEHGCGLFFCEHHLLLGGPAQQCARCAVGEPPYTPTPDHPEWTEHKATHPSWAGWRAEQAG